MNNLPNTPNFLIIGAARSGTTSLYLYMEQHPEIYFSPIKELNFFSNPSFWAKGFSWYEARFTPKSGNIKYVGEASTSYTRSPFLDQAPERIFNYNPSIKLIYVVRNPIDRLISHYLHNVNAGMENRTIEQVIENLSDEPIAWQGKYHYQLSKYLEFFDRSQIYVTSFDKLTDQPEQVAKDIFAYLEVDYNISLKKVGRVFNSSNKTTRKTEIGVKILNFYRKNIQYSALPYRLKKVFQNLSEIGSTPVMKPKLSFDHKKLLYEFYKNDTQLLSAEFDINTDEWFST